MKLSFMIGDKNDNEIEEKDFDFEARSNLVGFFDLLLKVDKRVNPHLYEDKKII